MPSTKHAAPEPEPPAEDLVAYFIEDATDRRVALSAATEIVAAKEDFGVAAGEKSWLLIAEQGYQFLRSRDSLRAVALRLIAGTPSPEGEAPMAPAVIDLSDINELPFTLGGTDAKGAAVSAPADTWTWTLADPDNTGATLTVSADTTSATVAAGNPDSTGTLTLNVTGQNTGLTGAQAILVVASAATAIDLVAGTPTPES